MKPLYSVFLPFALAFFGGCQMDPEQPEGANAVDRPNIVIILADDMGFSDLGSFGSEIATPNLDALASAGVRFTQFYTHTTCSPTRSMLLSGVDCHLNGLGNMEEWTAPNQRGVPGYEGILNDRIVTLPQLLLDAGYHTYMIGKWHMGKEPDKIPRARGFERDFTLLDGGGSYWDMMNITANMPQSLYTENGRYLKELPKDYYATEFYTDKMIEFIESNREDGRPFFAFVAHQAPHDPHHLPKEWRDRQDGTYDQGWDEVRRQRLERQVEMGITPEGTSLANRLPQIPAAAELSPEQRSSMGDKMELYSGMVENLDFHVGRLVNYLKETGEYENTLFLVFGDNGAEGNDIMAAIAGNPSSPNALFFEKNWSNENLGEPGSFPAYGPGWAQVSMTPFAQFKGSMAEGGIRNCLIVSGAGVSLPQGSIQRPIMHVADIMPTLLDIAGTDYPERQEDRELPPLMGKSWLPMLQGEVESLRTDQDYLAWQFSGNRAVRQGGWKIRWQWKPMGREDWELYHLDSDPSELEDVASKHPDKVQELIAQWQDYVDRNNVVIPDKTLFTMSRDPSSVGDGWPPIFGQRQFVPPAHLFKETDGR